MQDEKDQGGEAEAPSTSPAEGQPSAGGGFLPPEGRPRAAEG